MKHKLLVSIFKKKLKVNNLFRTSSKLRLAYVLNSTDLLIRLESRLRSSMFLGKNIKKKLNQNLLIEDSLILQNYNY